MNKVVFICLLSISLCYSSPTATQDNPVTPTAAATNTSTTAKVESPLPSTNDAAKKTSEPAITEALPVPKTTINTTTINATTTTNTTEKPTTPTNTSNNTTTDNKENTKKDDKTDKPPSTEVSPKPAATTTVKPDQKPTAKPQDVTTPKAITDKPTVAPHPDGKHEPAVVQARGFDGGSFVGGMILTLGLLAVGFIGFKYYKNHSERNYHTL